MVGHSNREPSSGGNGVDIAVARFFGCISDLFVIGGQGKESDFLFLLGAGELEYIAPGSSIEGNGKKTCPGTKTDDLLAFGRPADGPGEFARLYEV